MQLKRLWIKEYKNLKNFEILFEHNVSILIGKNWSWKSNLLEVILLIFRDIYWLQKSTFDYEISYLRKWYLIEIEKRNGKISWKKVWQNNWDQTHKEKINITYEIYRLQQDWKSDLFPNWIYSYHSWIDRDFKKLWNIQFKKWKSLWNFFDLNSYSIMIFLMYLFNKNDLLEDIGIWEILWMSFNFDYRKVTKYYSSFYYRTLNPWFRNMEQLDNDINELKKDMQYAYDEKEINNFKHKIESKKQQIKNIRNRKIHFFGESLKSLKETIGYDEKDAFNKLYEMFIDEFIKNISFEISDNNWKKFDSINLSEWQKQKILTIGLKNFFSSDEENLFLFDEPDTFLHPNWQKDFVPNLQKQTQWGIIVDKEGSYLADTDWKRIIVSYWFNCNFVITTHSPLLVWSSEDVDIIWLEENIDKQIEIVCHTNKQQCEKHGNCKLIDVYWNKAEFIYEHVFWLKSTRANDFEEKINELHNLLKKNAEGWDLTEYEKWKVGKLKEYLISKIWDDIEDEYLSYLSIDTLSKIIKENYEKNT